MGFVEFTGSGNGVIITNVEKSPLGAFIHTAQGENKKRWTVAELLLRERTGEGKLPSLNDVVAATREASELTDEEIDVRLMMEALAQ